MSMFQITRGIHVTSYTIAKKIQYKKYHIRIYKRFYEIQEDA